MNPINPNLTLNLNREGFGSAENLGAIVTAMNAVLSTIDASNNISLSIAYMDGSFATRDIELIVHDVSLGILQARNLIFNASLGALQTDDTNVDASLSAIDLRAFNSQIIYNASVGVLTAKGLSVDASLSAIDLRAFNSQIIYNASVGVLTATKTNVSYTTGIQDVSIATLKATDLITNASLGLTVHRYAPGQGITQLVGMKDASGVVGDIIYADGSIYYKFGTSAATGFWARIDASIVTFG